MSLILLPKALREKLGEDGAESLVEIINKATGNQKGDTIALVEEKFERRLSEETGKLRSDLIKWMFAFWLGQIGVLGSLILRMAR